VLAKITKILKLLNLQPNQESRSLVYDGVYKMLIKRQLPRCINILYECMSSYTNDLLLVLSYNKFNNFVTSASTRLRLPEGDAGALKHVGVPKYIIYIIYIVLLLVQIISCTNCTVRTSK
jgi:hypothetical protein